MASGRVLEGKYGIVTGASRGIGAAVAHNLAGKGCSLILNYTSESSGPKTEELAKTLASTHGVKAVPVRANMGKPDEPAKLVEAFKQAFPGKTIDVIIHNAGIAKNQRVEDITVEVFTDTYNINVLGPLLLMKAAKPHLPTDRSGRIVTVSSVSSSLGLITQSVYGGSKAALEAMTRTWSRELNENCTVNAVNPGPVATDMWGQVTDEFLAATKPFALNSPGMIAGEVDPTLREKMGGRPAEADEIAGVIAMLCLPESGWCTGSVVCANGGLRFGP